jgi:hypothetical protein
LGASAPTVAWVGCGAEVPAAHSCVPWEHPGSTPGVPGCCVCIVCVLCVCGVCVCVCVPVCVCVCVCVVRVVCVSVSVRVPCQSQATPCHERVSVRGANAPPTNVAGGQHARGTAHESSDAAAVAQATTRPCSPALPLVAARLHGCHDNLDSRSWRLPPTGTQAQIRNPAGRGARRIRRWRMVWG